MNSRRLLLAPRGGARIDGLFRFALNVWLLADLKQHWVLPRARLSLERPRISEPQLLSASRYWAVRGFSLPLLRRQSRLGAALPAGAGPAVPSLRA